MITRITGVLHDVTPTAAILAVGPVCCELLIPASSREKLSDCIGEQLSMHTVMQIDGDPSRGSLTPRLYGFASESDRDFWALLTTVKGIGARKALRAMAKSAAEIATYISAEDEKLLTQLPEIGKRTAQQIIAELKSKVDDYIDDDAVVAKSGGSEAKSLSDAAHEAVAVLVQLGERRVDALTLVERVVAVCSENDSAEQIIQNVYKLKAGGG